MSHATLYHITEKKEWEKAQQVGHYTADSLQEVGFIHLSTSDQYVKSAQRFYKGRTGLVVLEIDASKITNKVVFEDVHAGEAPFPHLFGTLNLDAVKVVHDFKENEDGTWTLL